MTDVLVLRTPSREMGTCSTSDLRAASTYDYASGLLTRGVEDGVLTAVIVVVYVYCWCGKDGSLLLSFDFDFDFEFDFDEDEEVDSEVEVEVEDEAVFFVLFVSGFALAAPSPSALPDVAN